MEAMQRHLPPRMLSGSKPIGGIYFWGRLAPGIAAGTVLQKALEIGLAFADGEIFYPDGAGSENLRLCFASVQSERMNEGMKRLGKALTAATRRKSSPVPEKIPVL